MKRVCIIGASGKLGRYMIGQSLDRGYAVHAVCRPRSVGKLADFVDRIEVFPGSTDDRAVLARALQGCDGVLCVLVPFGLRGYAQGTARAVLDLAPPGARLVFSAGWHIRRDHNDVYSWRHRLQIALLSPVFRLFRFADIRDHVAACQQVFLSDRDWTVVRGSDLEEGDSEGLPVWAEHVGDPILASNRTRRVDFACFMVAALTDSALRHKAPAIVSCRSPSALGNETRNGATG